MSKIESTRPDIREAIGRAVISNHLEEPRLGLGDVHRIAALAAAPALGSAAWRLKFANDASSYSDMYLRLLRRASRQLRIARRKLILQRAVVQAIREWLINHCPRCGGSGAHLQQGVLMVVCEACGGSGTWEWSDDRRAEALRLPVKQFVNGPWSGRLLEISRLVMEADSQTESALRRQLSWRQPRGRLQKAA